MKDVIKQIRKIKGVLEVEPAGENMAVVVFGVESKQPKSLKPEELVNGEIYVSEDNDTMIFRFKSLRVIIDTMINVDCYSDLSGGLDIAFNDWLCCIGKDRICRHATIEEKLRLIGEELKHGYNHINKA